MNIIAADVGGTNTRFIVVDADEPRNVLYEKRYQSGKFDGFEPLLQTFIDDSGSNDRQIYITNIMIVPNDTPRIGPKTSTVAIFTYSKKKTVLNTLLHQ